jgi:hypothetical protein
VCPSRRQEVDDGVDPGRDRGAEAPVDHDGPDRDDPRPVRLGPSDPEAALARETGRQRIMEQRIRPVGFDRAPPGGQQGRLGVVPDLVRVAHVGRISGAGGPATLLGVTLRTWRAADPKGSYEVVVVGAGGHGLATAFYLARNHGITDVAIVERGWLGGGNMARNTTVIRSNYLWDASAAIYEHGAAGVAH